MGREAVLTGCGADSRRHVPSMPSSAAPATGGRWRSRCCVHSI